MDNHMFLSWNSVVGDDDLVLHLGDVTLLSRPSKCARLAEQLQTLKGHKILLRGNHDRREMLKAYRKWGWIVLSSLSVGDTLFTHRPVFPVNKQFKVNIHGHCHGTHPSTEVHIDVGVDALRIYEPVEARHFVSLETCYQIALLYRMRAQNGK